MRLLPGQGAGPPCPQRPPNTQGPMGARLPTHPGSSAALTAELGGPPIAGLPARVGALAGELGEGAADAGGARRALAAVLHARLHVQLQRHQAQAVREGRGRQQLLALGALRTHTGAR